MESPDEAAFTFPAHMPLPEAQRLLAEAYASLDAGKMLRAALKRQRDEGWDPPGDVQYVVEPRVEAYPDGLGIALESDILLYDAFPGIDDCLAIFEDVVSRALVEATAKRVERWRKRNPA